MFQLVRIVLWVVAAVVAAWAAGVTASSEPATARVAIKVFMLVGRIDPAGSC